MTHRHRDLVVGIGFCLAYFGVMGALLALVLPGLINYRDALVLFVSLPALVVGAILVVAMHWIVVQDEVNPSDQH